MLISMQSVFVLEDDTDARTLLKLLFESEGAVCQTFGAVSELMDAYDQVEAFGLAVLDVSLGEGMPSGIDAYLWLREMGFGGRIVFLTGHARSHPFLAQEMLRSPVRVLEKPMGADEIARLLDERAGP